MLKLKDERLFRRDAYIDGAWVGGAARFKVDDPATGEVLAEVADLGADETRTAITRAHDAFPAWAAKTGKARAAILRTWFELIVAAQEDLARIMTAEQGKPLAETRGEVAYGASFIEWFGEEAKRVYGDVIPTNAHGRRIVVLKQAIGVVGAITPWNFPNAMITRKVAPALAAGCPVVIKPPSETPLSALALAELAERAGIPKGVFNVVTSTHASQVGLELTTNPLVKKFSFTGSTEVGKLLMQQCATTVKKISLELGGNAPFIVFDDADLEAAADGAIQSKFRNMGQTCVCANRILVQDDVYDAFAEKFASRVAKLKVGNGFDDGVQQGPLITEKAVAKVEHLLKDAVDRGAKIALGGKRHALGGTFFEPTVVKDVTPAMAIAQTEIFGPVATLFRFKDDAEAIRISNDTPFGLAAYFYTRDLARAWRVGEALEAGMVGINEGILSTEVAPFGGVKQSGLGREGSKYGLDEYMELKYMMMGGIGR